MLLLSLDTSSPSGSVAVLRDAQVLGIISTCTDEDYSSRMFRHVTWLLKELSLETSDFDVFAVSSGPGSFTGLRVGLTAVKGWAEAHNRPIVSVSALEAIAAQATTGVDLLVPVFDARRSEVYFGFYRQASIESDGLAVLEPMDEAQVAPPVEFLEQAAARADHEQLVIVTPAPELLTDPLTSLNSSHRGARQLRLERVSGVLAAVIGRIGYHRARMGKTETALTLDANYVRRTDAELKWRGPS